MALSASARIPRYVEFLVLSKMLRGKTSSQLRPNSLAKSSLSFFLVIASLNLHLESPCVRSYFIHPTSRTPSATRHPPRTTCWQSPLTSKGNWRASPITKPLVVHVWSLCERVTWSVCLRSVQEQSIRALMDILSHSLSVHTSLYSDLRAVSPQHHLWRIISG